MKYNVVVLGDSGVGKSSIIEALLSHENNTSFAKCAKNIGEIKTTEKSIVYNNIFHATFSQIKLLDTGGHPKYNTDKFQWLGHELETHNIDGIVIVCNMNDNNSFKNTDVYFNFISKYTTSIPIIFLNNKLDKVKILPIAKINDKFKNFRNLKYFDTSAKIGAIAGNIYFAFCELISMMFNSNNSKKRQREEYTNVFDNVKSKDESQKIECIFLKPTVQAKNFTSVFL
ncbi:Ras like GTPase [Bodo saltans virus]|uniref:Ras like GTPase n=1 Tax=Bodo saltans virus TaxID=2024608 RepID=A0A2H4UV28_9VIRU|nr:Ras like GTPase [Bodo saltans virus]ATZ80717.1 Ras like GTPase [Bodo saltans virus]